MNNPDLFDNTLAGGFPYPHTEKYEYSDWYCTTGLTDTSAYRTIRFNVQASNLLLHWTNSYLQLTGRMEPKETSGAAFTNATPTSFIHNAACHLFDSVKFSIGGTCVENINSPGHCSSLIFNVLLPRSKAKNDGLTFLWFPDTTKDASLDNNHGFIARQKYIIAAPEEKGRFVIRLPMYMLFGTVENFYALRGYPVEVELNRGPDHTALITAADAAEPAKIKITDIKLNIPVIEPSNVELLNNLKSLKDPTPYLYSFRQRKTMFAPIGKDLYDYQIVFTTDSYPERPQMVFVGFQKNQTNDQKYNHGIYTHEDVETMYVKMNNRVFPENLVKADFANNDTGFFYHAMLNARANYLQNPSRYGEGSHIDPASFLSLYAIYVFDCTKGEYQVAGQSIVSSLHIHFKKQTGDNLKVYIAWFNDRTLECFSDGKSINIKSLSSESYRQ
jgi:hypothetical protein